MSDIYAEVSIKVELEFKIQVRAGSLPQYTADELKEMFGGNTDEFSELLHHRYRHNFFFNPTDIVEKTEASVKML